MEKVGERLVAGFTKVYPTPEVEEFTLAPARAESGAVAQRLQERTKARNAVHVLVDAGLLPEGTRLRMVPRHGVPASLRDRIQAWADEDGGRAVATWVNNTAKPLRWQADGQPYTPTGLAEHIFTTVTGRKADGIQGTTWWQVDTTDVPDGVDPEEWAALAGATLVDLAKQVKGVRRDWTDLHTALQAMPSGRWTTYGDLATAIGSHAVPVGTHLATCTQCPTPWRVLTAKGTVSRGFRWSDPTRTDTVEDALAADGITLTNGIADSNARMPLAGLQQLLDR